MEPRTPPRRRPGRLRRGVARVFVWIAEAILRRPLFLGVDDVVHRIPDNPNSCYVWVLKDGHENSGKRLAELLASEYRRRYGRIPRALHLVVIDVEEIKDFKESDIRRLIDPWLLEDRGEPKR